ncbi:methyltransferase [Xanthobacter sp. V13C-7B]|uniref:methyltransferase n=1 Tax=Xanthobacter variabilis TaxID=3119932 RepID=UPI00372A6AD2
MAKLTKAQRKAHAEAEAILTKERLSDDERFFVLENWHEGATHINGAAGAFFTPPGLARDFSLEVGSGRIIDLCAGIGALSFFASQPSGWADRATELVCVEINPRYVEVGRKVVPEARWINADVFDWRTLDLGRFGYAISNPPFGRVRRSGNGPRYQGAEFEFHVIDIAAELADYGAFIVPQQSASFRYSGARYYERMPRSRGAAFEAETGYRMDIGAGVDTTVHQDDWKDGAPRCEIVCFSFGEDRERMAAERSRVQPFGPINHAPHRPAQQLALL